MMKILNEWRIDGAECFCDVTVMLSGNNQRDVMALEVRYFDTF